MKACDNCGADTIDITQRVNIYPDHTGADAPIAVAGSVCRQCHLKVVEGAVQAEVCGDSGRWEVYSIGRCKSLASGTYGRPPTEEENARPQLILDSERRFWRVLYN